MLVFLPSLSFSSPSFPSTITLPPPLLLPLSQTTVEEQSADDRQGPSGPKSCSVRNDPTSLPPGHSGSPNPSLIDRPSFSTYIYSDLYIYNLPDYCRACMRCPASSCFTRTRTQRSHRPILGRGTLAVVGHFGSGTR